MPKYDEKVIMKVTRKLPKYPFEEEHEEAKEQLGKIQKNKSEKKDKDID